MRLRVLGTNVVPLHVNVTQYRIRIVVVVKVQPKMLIARKYSCCIPIIVVRLIIFPGRFDAPRVRSIETNMHSPRRSSIGRRVGQDFRLNRRPTGGLRLLGTAHDC